MNYDQADPTPEDLETPAFKAVSEAIKTWDINIPEAYEGYMGTNGNHVIIILEALRKLQNGIDRAIGRLGK